MIGQLPGSLYGMQVFESPVAVEREQHRFPKSKKHRIRKKWAKDNRNFIKVHKCYMVNNSLLCSPAIMLKLKEELHG